MKKGKKFLSLFLAAALAVTGINLGTPATVNAAGESEQSVKVTVKYIMKDSTDDNATIKDDKVINVTADDGAYTYDATGDDAEFELDGYKYTLDREASILTATPDDAATAGQTGEKAVTIILKYTRTEVTPLPPVPEGQVRLTIKYAGPQNLDLGTRYVDVTPDDGGRTCKYEPDDTDKSDKVKDGKTYVYAQNNHEKYSVVVNGDKTITLYFDLKDSPVTGETKNYLTIKRVDEEGTLLRTEEPIEIQGDVPGTYTVQDADKKITVDDKTYVLIEEEDGYRIILDSTSDDANNYVVTLEYKPDTVDPDATADDAYLIKLTDKITKANNALKDTTKNYPESAKNALKAAIADAQKVVDEFKAGETTKKTIDDAVEALDTAITKFKNAGTNIQSVNKAQLQAAIVAAQALKANEYTSASWANFQSALSIAVAVNNNSNATQAEVDNARAALLSAQGALKKVVTKLTITDNLTGKESKTVKVAAGKKVKLTATASPADAANKSVTWSIDKKYAKYAKVKNGVVTTTKKGAGKTVVVKATTNDGSKITKTVKVQIMGKMVTSVKFKKAPKTAKIGKSFTLKTTIKSKGKGKLNKTLKWTSSNTKIATVNSKGKVTISKKAKKGQKVTITATATDGSGKKAKATIKIKK